MLIVPLLTTFPTTRYLSCWLFSLVFYIVPFSPTSPPHTCMPHVSYCGVGGLCRCLFVYVTYHAHSLWSPLCFGAFVSPPSSACETLGIEDPILGQKKTAVMPPSPSSPTPPHFSSPHIWVGGVAGGGWGSIRGGVASGPQGSSETSPAPRWQLFISLLSLSPPNQSHPS
jgi:hypothetical protein